MIFFENKKKFLVDVNNTENNFTSLRQIHATFYQIMYRVYLIFLSSAVYHVYTAEQNQDAADSFQNYRSS